jgi:hypothetical protein
MNCQNEYCDSTDAEKRRQNTAYVDDDRNFAVLCDECQKKTNEYWRDQWNDYYQGCM